MSAAAASRISCSGPASSAAVGRRPAVGHLQCLARKRDRRRGIAFERGRGLANERRQPGAVDLGRSDAQPIADAVADDRIRPAGAAGARHEHLQALRRVGGCFLAPYELDQLIGPYRTAAAGRQRRQQRPGAVADHRPSSPAHVLEQTQRDFHAGQSKSPCQTKKGPPVEALRHHRWARGMSSRQLCTTGSWLSRCKRRIRCARRWGRTRSRSRCCWSRPGRAPRRPGGWRWRR